MKQQSLMTIRVHQLALNSRRDSSPIIRIFQTKVAANLIDTVLYYKTKKLPYRTAHRSFLLPKLPKQLTLMFSNF